MRGGGQRQPAGERSRANIVLDLVALPMSCLQEFDKTIKQRTEAFTRYPELVLNGFTYGNYAHAMPF